MIRGSAAGAMERDNQAEFDQVQFEGSGERVGGESNDSAIGRV